MGFMAAPRPPLYVEPDLVVQHDPAPAQPAPDIEVVTHELEVVETGAFARAVCRGCAWQGPARRSRAVATADAQQHP
jgi:hypothetical protein